MDLLELGTATLAESGAQPLDPRVRPAWAGAQGAGTAVTVSCPAADNLAIHVAVAEAAPGSMLVVAVDGLPQRGWWGEVLTTAAQARGIAGLVIDACVRDIDAIERLRFPVFAIGLALVGTDKTGGGRVGAAVTVGDVVVEQGAWIVGDTDGVVCIPAHAIDAVIAAARDRRTREQHYFEALRGGRTTLDLLALDASRAARDGSDD